MATGSTDRLRDHGLTVVEHEQLRHCREYFALPAAPTPGASAIVGLLLIPGERPLELKSGQHGGPCGGTQRGGIPRGPGSGSSRFTLTHVEGHAAAVMHQRQIPRATLLIELAPCGACDPSIPRMLPPGARLEVVSPYDTDYYWSCQIPG
jgi:SCP1.201-like deaminase